MKHLDWVTVGPLLTVFVRSRLMTGLITALSGQKRYKNQSIKQRKYENRSTFTTFLHFRRKPYVVIHDNVPDFPDKDKTKKSL